jgi:HEAT repeat protein
MSRSWPWLLAVGLLLSPASVRAQEEDPILYGRRLTRWQEILSTGKEQTLGGERAGLALGSLGLSHPAVAGRQLKMRQAALVVLDLAGLTRNAKSLGAAVTALREDPEEQIRAGAAGLLGAWGAKIKEEKLNIRFVEGRDALVTALQDQAGPVRQAAAAAVGKLTVEDARGAVTALTGVLKDSYAPARLAAADALRGLGKDAAAAAPALADLLKDKSAAVLLRMQAALALGRIGAPDALTAVGALKEALADSKGPQEVRKAAADAIGLLGKDAASETATTLGAALDSKEPLELRRAAATALDRFGADAKPAISGLKKSLKDEDRFVRCLTMHTVGQLGKALGDDMHEVVLGLLDGLIDNNLEVRVAAIETLGTLGKEAVGTDAKTVEDKLTLATKDTRDAVRDAAVLALKRFSAER